MSARGTDKEVRKGENSSEKLGCEVAVREGMGKAVGGSGGGE